MGVRKNGKKFLAQINRGKFVHLGTFDIEEEAAAAVQDYLDNKTEATRLRLLAKNKNENEPKAAVSTESDVEKRALFQKTEE